jgi:hypothetical protein
MLRRYLILGVGALALAIMLGAPGQVHAQRMRGGFRTGVTPGFRSGFSPGFHRGSFGPHFGPGPRTFGPRFNRFDRFEDRFSRGSFNRRFDRIEDRFENRFNRGIFGISDPRFFTPGFDPRFFTTGFNPTFFPF